MSLKALGIVSGLVPAAVGVIALVASFFRRDGVAGPRLVGILEAGSASGKIFIVDLATGTIEVLKATALGFSAVFGKGFLADDDARTLIGELERVCASRGIRLLGAAGTDGLRAAWNKRWLSRMFRKALGVDLQVISARAEAMSLGRAFLESDAGGKGLQLPAVVCHVGGGSGEIVLVNEDRSIEPQCWGLRIGVVRLHRAAAARGRCDEDFYERRVRKTLRRQDLPRASTIYITGCAARAARNVALTPVLTPASIEHLIRRVKESGPPRTLTDEARCLFLGGLVALRELLKALEADRAIYVELPSVGYRLAAECLAMARGEGNGNRNRDRSGDGNRNCSGNGAGARHASMVSKPNGNGVGKEDGNGRPDGMRFGAGTDASTARNGLGAADDFEIVLAEAWRRAYQNLRAGAYDGR